MSRQPALNTARQYRSEVMASIHEMMKDLYEADVIDDNTMREFDELCLFPLIDLQSLAHPYRT